MQTGFRLPWSAPLLVPRVPAFGLRDLVADGDVVGVGTADGHVAIRAGPWLFLLAVDTTSRFPHVDTVIPKETAVRSRLRLDPADAASLAAGLAKLPGGGESHAPVTLDLNHPPCVRAREAPSGPAAELPLLRSTVSGPPVRLCTDRRLLGRALDLGFREIHIVKPDSPLLCRDETRVFVWMPLDATEAIPPQREVQHANAASEPAPPSAPLPRKRKPAMPTPPSKPSAPDADNGAGHERNDMLDLVAEVDSLRALLQEAATRLGRLAAALKQQRR